MLDKSNQKVCGLKRHNEMAVDGALAAVQQPNNGNSTAEKLIKTAEKSERWKVAGKEGARRSVSSGKCEGEMENIEHPEGIQHGGGFE